MGLSEKAARFMKKTLVSFKHKILLVGVPSEGDFCNSLRHIIHGTWQGTGWSPILWSVVDYVIISLMEKPQSGKFFMSPNRSIETIQMVDVYVDDSNQAVNEEGVWIFNKEHRTHEMMVTVSRKAYQGYARYLFTSGGRLEKKKCKFYWISFKRVGTKYKYKRKEQVVFKVDVGF